MKIDITHRLPETTEDSMIGIYDIPVSKIEEFLGEIGFNRKIGNCERIIIDLDYSAGVPRAYFQEIGDINSAVTVNSQGWKQTFQPGKKEVS